MTENIKGSGEASEREALEKELADSKAEDAELKKQLAEAMKALGGTEGAEEITREKAPVEPTVPIKSKAPIEAELVDTSKGPDTQDAELTEPEENRGEEKSGEIESPAEVTSFIAKFKLESILPPEFKGLKPEQQLMVMQSLQKRIVDIVKSDAETQYSKAIASKGKLKSIGSSFSKEKHTKTLEAEIFAKIRDTDEGKSLIASDLDLLVKATSRQEIRIGKNNKLEIIFMAEEKDIPPAERELIENFNLAANNFRNIPYEWGQEKSGKHKKAYDKVKAEYEKAKNAVLVARSETEIPNEKGKAMLEVFGVDHAIKMDQLINTHPEFEKALDGFEKSGTGADLASGSLKNLITKMGGSNFQYAALTAGGFVARMAARGAVLASGATGITAAPTIAIGALVGGVRGGMRAKDTLADRSKQARHGQKDTSKEKLVISDSTTLNKKLGELLDEIENAPNEQERAKKLSMLDLRIDHTTGKIEKGLVNFGDAKSTLSNQFNLVNNLNRALAIKEQMAGQSDANFKKHIDAWLKTESSFILEKTSKAQKDFIFKQWRNGAIMGGGFATFGYTLRWAGEHFGWWGEAGKAAGATSATKEAPSADETQGLIKRTESWLKILYGKFQNSEQTEVLSRGDAGVKDAISRIHPSTGGNNSDMSYQKIFGTDKVTTSAPSGNFSDRMSGVVNPDAPGYQHLDKVANDYSIPKYIHPTEGVSSEAGVGPTIKSHMENMIGVTETKQDPADIADKIRASLDAKAAAMAGGATLTTPEAVTPLSALEGHPLDHPASFEIGSSKANLEHAYEKLILNNTTLVKSAEGIVLDQNGATRALNETGNLMRLTEGHDTAGISVAEFTEAVEIENGTLKILDPEKFNDILGRLHAHSEELLGKGVFNNPNSATGYIKNVNWLDKVQANGMHDAVEGVGKGIVGHPEVTAEEIENLSRIPNPHEITTSDIAPESGVGVQIDETTLRGKPPVGDAFTTEIPAHEDHLPEPTKKLDPLHDVLGNKHPDATVTQHTADGDNVIYDTSRSGTGRATELFDPTHDNRPSGQNVTYGPTRNSIDSFISPEMMGRANSIFEQNIQHIFPENTKEIWDVVGPTSANEVLEITPEKAEAEGLTNLISYLDRLKEVTGLEPKGRSLFNWKPETVANFIKRTTEWAARNGKLEDIRIL